MRRSLLLYFAAPIALGCSASTEPPIPPLLRGTITSRAPGLVGVQTAAGFVMDTFPQMLVEAVPGAGAGPRCDQAALFSFSAHTFVRTTSGVRADTSMLSVGRRVRVGAFGVILSSCPAQAYADTVEVE